MMKIAASACLLSALAAGLIGCSSGSSKQPEENPNVFPADYKNEILLTMTNTLEDPTNIRGAFISEPVLRSAGKDERYVVCVRSDSRNANKNYTGSKDRIGYFYAGHVKGAMRKCCIQALPGIGKALPGQEVPVVRVVCRSWSGFARRLSPIIIHLHKAGLGF